jgi:hypothetical protein
MDRTHAGVGLWRRRRSLVLLMSLRLLFFCDTMRLQQPNGTKLWTREFFTMFI